MTLIVIDHYHFQSSNNRKVMFRKEAMLWLLGDVTGKFTFYGANEVDNTGKENRAAFFIRGIKGSKINRCSLSCLLENFRNLVK